MKRLKTIKYITETSIDDMINQVMNGSSNNNIEHVIQAAIESRTAFGLKVQELIDRLKSM